MGDWLEVCLEAEPHGKKLKNDVCVSGEARARSVHHSGRARFWMKHGQKLGASSFISGLLLGVLRKVGLVLIKFNFVIISCDG
jgi:hypothetical protein